MNLTGTGYQFDKTNAYKRMKQNNDGKCYFLIMYLMKTVIKIIDIIFLKVNYFL